MKVLLVSSAALLSAIGAFILVWQLFGGSYRKEAQIELPCNVVQTQQQKVQVWDSLWLDQVGSRNKTNIGWTFTISRRYYDPEYRELLLGRKWKATAVAQQRKKGDKASRDFDGMREKRASSIVTYFCIFVLVLSLIRAALDMNSNLKKSREENDHQTINLDSRRCSLNDFKLAQAHLKKKEQTQRRACLLRRAMTIVENPLGGGGGGGVVAAGLVATSEKKTITTQSMNNLDSKEPLTEKQSSITDACITDSPTKLRPRFSSLSATPAHLRRMSFPALRRGSSMEVVQADMDDLIAHHSPETKRRMRLLRH